MLRWPKFKSVVVGVSLRRNQNCGVLRSFARGGAQVVAVLKSLPFLTA